MLSSSKFLPPVSSLQASGFIIDGDLITINDSSDLSFAIQCSRVLKLQIQMNNSETSESNNALKPAAVVGLKTQLRSIRDQVNKLLDSLDVTTIQTVANGEQGTN